VVDPKVRLGKPSPLEEGPPAALFTLLPPRGVILENAETLDRNRDRSTICVDHLDYIGDGEMKFVNVRELRINASRIVKSLRSQDVVVTHRGKPAAAVLYLDEDLLEDFVFAHHPTVIREAEEAYREYKREGGISHEEMKRRVARRRG
jgi:antitoxin (DNA-binding transcriptional repressor) of toxin-antitoxin stability system